MLAAIALFGATAGGSHELRFEERAIELGVRFHHQDGRNGEKYYPETTASGGGWIDFDGDGDLDLYLINGAAAPGIRQDPVPRNALYENRDGRFVDVTERSATGDSGYGMGMCVGDYDADGRLDFFVTNYGADRLFHNLGDGRFEERVAEAGIDEDRWSSSCAFGDLDADGDLDLYVSHYLDFSWERNPLCTNAGDGSRMYCHPSAFRGVTDSLFINRGDGTFVEEGRARGLATGSTEKGLDVLVSDLDGDADLDIYVANDGTSNRLYANDGTGHFEDIGLASGVALSRFGDPQAGMGTAAGDTDGDGRLDLVVTNFAMEYHTLYRNIGELRFDDRSAASGLERPTHLPVGWGVALFDADNDADLDLAIASGHMQEGIELLGPAQRYAQPNFLFANDGRGVFHDVSASAGPAWSVAKVSRGLAVADWNDDGRLDLLITNNNGEPDLLENRSEAPGHWLGVVLEGPAENPFAFGATVELTAGERRQLRQVRSGGGFQSQSDLRLHFGLGEHGDAVSIRITWPDSTVQVEATDRLDRYWPIAYRRPAKSRAQGRGEESD